MGILISLAVKVGFFAFLIFLVYLVVKDGPSPMIKKIGYDSKLDCIVVKKVLLKENERILKFTDGTILGVSITQYNSVFEGDLCQIFCNKLDISKNSYFGCVINRTDL